MNMYQDANLNEFQHNIQMYKVIQETNNELATKSSRKGYEHYNELTAELAIERERMMDVVSNEFYDYTDILLTNETNDKMANKLQPMYYYIGKLTFTNSPLPNGENERTVFTDRIHEAEALLKDYAQSNNIAGEIVVKNLRFNEVVYTANVNFTKKV